MFETEGNCPPTSFYAQYKGWHVNQLVSRIHIYKVQDSPNPLDIE